MGNYEVLLAAVVCFAIAWVGWYLFLRHRERNLPEIVDDEFRSNIHHAIALHEKGQYRDAIAILKMTVPRTRGENRLMARVLLLESRAQDYVNTVRTYDRTRPPLDFFVEARDEANNLFKASQTCWVAQQSVVLVAGYLSWIYDGPSGLMANILSTGGTGALSKASADSLQRLERELQRLSRYLDAYLKNGGKVTDEQFVGVAEFAFKLMDRVVEGGQRVTKVALQAFADVDRQKVEETGTEGYGIDRVAEVRLIAAARWGSAK